MKLKETVANLRDLVDGKPGRAVRECEECGEATDRLCVYCKEPLCVECSPTGECYRCVQARKKR